MSKTLNGYMALKDKFLFGASVFTAQWWSNYCCALPGIHANAEYMTTTGECWEHIYRHTANQQWLASYTAYTTANSTHIAVIIISYTAFVPLLAVHSMRKAETEKKTEW